MPARQLLYIFSVTVLITGGFFLAKAVSGNHETAWIYVTAFYGAWIIFSLLLLLRKAELRELLRRGHNNIWYIIPGVVSIPIFFLIFIPNRHVLKLDLLFVLNVLICLANPWLEELYWRGLASTLFKDRPFISFFLSAVCFGLSHALVFGINSPGIMGMPGFAGAFAIGAIWWFCLRKTGSLRGCIVPTFL